MTNGATAEPIEPERVTPAAEILPDTALAVPPAATEALVPSLPSSEIEIAATAAAVPPRIRPAAIASLAAAPADASAAETDDAPMPMPPPLPRPPPDLAFAASPSPAERLGLSPKTRASAETCLAQAIYFESRGETVRGQIGVAQVIMNRVFSRFYPDSVCAVVYQNAHRRNACQFSFACDGRRNEIKDQPAWELAQRIAKLTLGGRIWDAEIGKATHYHATFVHPWWVDTMTKVTAYGIHVFYRPTRWGDGSDEPNWSLVAHTAIAAVDENVSDRTVSQ
jgi:spore germination cell wall hydrolase CwlJ-like protein